VSRGILGNAFIVGILTAASRVLGLVREMLQSRLIGAGVEQSAFTLAFAIPNMMRKLFGEGALTAAFVPVFRGEVEAVGVAKAARLARAVMTTVFAALASITILACLGLGLFAHFAALGPRAELIVTLVQILLPYMLFICGAAFGMGVLNALGRFKAAGFMPALLNILWIAALATLCFFPSLPARTRIIYTAWAILFAGAVQMVFMFICMHRMGVTPRLTFLGWHDEKTRLVWRNLGIAAFGAGAIQVNYMLDQILAQWASPWTAAVVGYAERLMDLPLGVIGVAFGTVLLPTFAGHFAKNDLTAARTALTSSVNSLMFVMLPAAAGLFILAPETTRVIYEGGTFNALATIRVSRALAVYALGLGFFGFQKSLVPWFQAQNDMKTPLRVSVITVCLNACLNILAVTLLPVEWRHVGLAASTTFCAAVGCTILVHAAHRKNGSLTLRSSCLKPVTRMLLASILMAAALFFLRPLLAHWNQIFSLATLILSGAFVYFIASLILHRGTLRAYLKRPRRTRS
jgi:putative peptidoglycan lipid II flippase